MYSFDVLSFPFQSSLICLKFCIFFSFYKKNCNFSGIRREQIIVCFKRNDKTFIPFPISFDCNVATIDSIPLCVIQSIISKEYGKKYSARTFGVFL